MNEPKRRGRPPRLLMAVEGADARTEDAPVEDAEVAAIERAPSFDLHDQAQAYALRVWHGQTADLGRGERIKRVKAALEGQGLPFEGVTLP